MDDVRLIVKHIAGDSVTTTHEKVVSADEAERFWERAFFRYDNALVRRKPGVVRIVIDETK